MTTTQTFESVSVNFQILTYTTENFGGYFTKILPPPPPPPFNKLSLVTVRPQLFKRKILLRLSHKRNYLSDTMSLNIIHKLQFKHYYKVPKLTCGLNMVCGPPFD